MENLTTFDNLSHWELSREYNERSLHFRCKKYPSDNDPPKPITENGLTKMGYIFVYKKTRTETFTTE